MTLNYAIPTESAIIASVTESKGSFKKGHNARLGGWGRGSDYDLTMGRTMRKVIHSIQDKMAE